MSSRLDDMRKASTRETEFKNIQLKPSISDKATNSRLRYTHSNIILGKWK